MGNSIKILYYNTQDMTFGHSYTDKLFEYDCDYYLLSRISEKDYSKLDYHYSAYQQMYTGSRLGLAMYSKTEVPFGSGFSSQRTFEDEHQSVGYCYFDIGSFKLFNVLSPYPTKRIELSETLDYFKYIQKNFGKGSVMIGDLHGQWEEINKAIGSNYKGHAKTGNFTKDNDSRRLTLSQVVSDIPMTVKETVLEPPKEKTSDKHLPILFEISMS